MKLVILGTAESRALAPYDDKGWEIWGCQPAISYDDVKRVDLIFELHADSYCNKPDIIKRINDSNIPVMMQRHYTDIPKSKAFPLDDMIEFWRGKHANGAKYYTSTIAYMIAYALFKGGYEAIALYGVHLSADEEYGWQRQAMEYWVGVAEGMGIKVFIPEDSSICAGHRLYAYDADSALLTEVRKLQNELDGKMRLVKARLDATVQEMYEHNGAVKALAHIHRVFS